MRGYFVYYLKILLAISLIAQLASSSIKLSMDDAYKKLLALRSLPFEDCGSKYRVNYLNIDGCSKVPCPMARDSNVKVTVLFDDNGAVSYLKHRVHWVLTMNIKAAISPDPCDGDHNCLLNINEGKTYWANIYVNDSLPLMAGTMLWEATGEDVKKILICFKVPIVITL